MILVFHSHGQSNVVKELLQSGATLQCNADNQTPLFAALRVNNYCLYFTLFFNHDYEDCMVKHLIPVEEANVVLHYSNQKSNLH